ncbi:MAG: bifunctional folylpolyglutamate synthase/dihydrofolate synthase [Bacteroidetes bacterium]|nr:bifunctional folylpolyglutamate synthase/dihydrofolate synthase [Bacteroidota bacterium]
MTYTESIQYLYGLQKYGMKFGLHGINTLLKELGNPHNDIPTIHIAGTNGKGSTAAMIAAICTAAGYKTGLYTSPHILRFEERIRINGKSIPPREVARYVTQLRPLIKAHQVTFFEAVTAIAFLYFANERVDIAIIETGLGGRLDATNVLVPLISVITTIGYDHTHILGTTLESIAREKAGIIKPNVPIITGEQKRQVLQVLSSVAKEKRAPLVLVKWHHCVINSTSLEGSIIDYKTSKGTIQSLSIELAGEYQVYNAAVAIKACLMLAEQFNYGIHENHIRDGLSHITEYTNFYGRLTILRKNPLVLVDVAHNPDAMRSLVQSIRKFHLSNFRVIFGAMKDKDIEHMVEELQPVCQEVIAVAPKTDRAAPPSVIAEIFSRKNVSTHIAPSVAKGIQSALESKDSLPILVTGSHFVCAEVYAWYKKKKYLTINQ